MRTVTLPQQFSHTPGHELARLFGASGCGPSVGGWQWGMGSGACGGRGGHCLQAGALLVLRRETGQACEKIASVWPFQSPKTFASFFILENIDEAICYREMDQSCRKERRKW